MTLFSDATRPPAEHPAGEGLLPSQGGHRPLHEPVLQSADEAVAGEPLMASVEGAAGQHEARQPSSRIHPLDSPLSNPLSKRFTERLAKVQDEVAQYAALEPLKATLMAVGAGALLALLAARVTRRTRKSVHRPTRR